MLIYNSKQHLIQFNVSLEMSVFSLSKKQSTIPKELILATFVSKSITYIKKHINMSMTLSKL